MLFDDPTTLPQAVQILLAKNIMPTNLDTQGIRQLNAALRNDSFHSAKTLNPYLLQLYKDRIGGILNPPRGVPGTQYNQGYIRESVKEFLAQVGYKPKPGEAGTLKDFSSDPRINLVIDTNVATSQGQGWWTQGQQKSILDQWPAQELFRAGSAKVPRDWIMRWRLAGNATGQPIGTGWTITPDGRLIALKNNPIWFSLGSSSLFNDALNTWHAPYAFNSHMRDRDITRKITESIGLMKPGQAAPEPMTLAQALQQVMKGARN